jgi:integrase
MGKLTARTVAAITAKGRYSDGDNLVLQVGANGSKSWLFCFMFGMNPARPGKRKTFQMGLGPVDLVPLAKAREQAFKYRQMLLEDINPLEHRRTQRLKREMPTFKTFAEEWIAANQARWKNDKHKTQWKSSLRLYAEPVIGDMRVDAITTDDVMRVLEPIWSAKPETASRVQQRLAKIFDAAKARRLRADNPATWKGVIAPLLPAPGEVKKNVKPEKHHGALSYTAIPKLMAELRERDSVSARALEFCILTAARTNEVINATWAEIDLEEKTWTVPAAKMKQGREHRVPLPDRAVALLKALPRNPDNEYVFPSDIRFRRPLSDMAMLEMIRGLRGRGVTVHGTARSGFRTWAGETGQPLDAAEAALGHVVGDKTERAYARGDLLSRRRVLMEAWSAFCAAPPKDGHVVPMRRKGKAS